VKHKAKIIDILRGIAPTIATALGGPMAGVAVRTLANELIGKPDASDDEVQAAILSATGQDLVRLKQIEADFSAQMAEAGVELERIAADDRASARLRQSKTGDIAPTVLGGAVIIGFFAVLAYVTIYGLPTESGPVLALLIGSLATGLSQVLNFYFGSSVGSKNKDGIIASLKGGAI